MPICEKCQKSFATTFGYLQHDCQVMEDCICGMEFVLTGHKEECPAYRKPVEIVEQDDE